MKTIASLVAVAILAAMLGYFGLRMQIMHDFLDRIEADQAKIIRNIEQNDAHLGKQDAMFARDRAHMFAQDKSLEEIRRVIVGKP
jgi:hypothetical protein